MDESAISTVSPVDPGLLNKTHAAKYLSTTVSHVDRLVEEGMLGYVKVGRFIRFTVDDLVEYIATAHVAPHGGRK